MSLGNNYDFDIVRVQKMQDSIANATGMSLMFYKDNNVITDISNQPSLISDVIDNSQKAQSIIDGYTMDMINNAMRMNRYTTGICSNGLVKIAVPVMKDGKVFAVVAGGDVFTSAKSENELQSDAANFEIDAATYINAAKSVAVLDNNKIDLYCQMISDTFNAYFDVAMQESQQVDYSYDGSNNREIAGIIYNISDFMAKGNDNVSSISKVIDQLIEITKQSEDNITKSKDIVKAIQNIALNTRILGFNASIEAARAKESGKGFGVIAQEVRSLADVSATSTEQIEGIIQKLEEASKEISSLIKEVAKGCKTNSDGKLVFKEQMDKLKSLVSSDEE